MATPRMDSFTRAYFEAALWASSDESDDQGGEPLDKNYDISDFDPATRDKMIADCADFQDRYGAMLDNAYGEGGIDSGRAGHNFWLSRNGHGAGFFDDDLDDLQEAAKSYGEFNLYVGDPDEDGERLIYGTPLGEYGRPETRPGAREARGAHARAPRVRAPRGSATGQWDVAAGRQILFNGQPFAHLAKEGDTSPTEADGATHLIAELFNREGVTPATIHARHMGRASIRGKIPHRRGQ
jgi:hypothetical protein